MAHTGFGSPASSSGLKAPWRTLPSLQPSIRLGIHDSVAPSGLTGPGSTSLALERVYTGKRVLAPVSVIQVSAMVAQPSGSSMTVTVPAEQSTVTTAPSG